MKILERLRKGSPRPESDPGERSADEGGPPFPGYDKLDDREVGVRLAGLSQVELAAVHEYERSHRERPEVLHRLRYMRESEPLPGYDALDSDGVVEALAGADAETVKAVRDYERKFQRRHAVSAEVARVLPTAEASPAEDRAREEKDARLREGFADRESAGLGG